MILTDLHCHILPGIDDGAKSIEQSTEMLEQELGCGVRKVALTSHFDCEREPVEAFLERRHAAFSRLNSMLAEHPEIRSAIELKTAAEVLYSPNLVYRDVSELCIEGTGFILIELPVQREPYNLDKTIYGLQKKGYDPIIAHVERYDYLMNEPGRICEMVQNGIYFQMNSAALTGKGRFSAYCMNLIEWELVQIVASDAHGVCERRPNLDLGMGIILKKLGKKTADRICRNCEVVFSGQYPDEPDPYCPKKVFGRWR